MLTRQTQEKGATLMELLIVVLISTIIVGALVFATIASLRNAQFSKNQTQATKLAQEGIEKIRTARDRNQCINFVSGNVNINSWDGDNTRCNGTGTSSFWSYQINGNCNNCNFNINSDGKLQNFNASADVPPLGAEQPIPSFRRYAVITDDASSFNKSKKVTVIVAWTDFSGSHTSKLTTILRRIR